MTHHVKSNSDDYICERTSWKFFANRPDSSVEIADKGVYVGIENIRKFYEGVLSRSGEDIGTMFEHDLCSPMIAVAKDCKTARGVWFSPGHETGRFYGSATPVATWTWGKLNVDFIKEDGEWKIWHYHWYRTFRVPFHESWTEAPLPPTRPLPEGVPQPTYPCKYHNPYSVDAQMLPIPPCPDDYETWTDDRPPV